VTRKAKQAGPEAIMSDNAVANAEQQAEQAPDAAALATENASLRDRLLRSLADAENSRRQASRAAADARQYGISGFARELLAVADNLQRALDAAEHPDRSVENAALIEGVRATERMLVNIFDRFGIRKIQALNAPFDPNLHEAVMEVADPSHPPGTAVSVMEDGYTIGDRLLRPARVAVAKQRSSSQQREKGAEAAAAADVAPHDGLPNRR
jgi:molecular chaperone GrpE